MYIYIYINTGKKTVPFNRLYAVFEHLHYTHGFYLAILGDCHKTWTTFVMFNMS